MSKFKNIQGAWYTKAMFSDTAAMEDRHICMYTTRDEDHTIGGKTYPSLYKLYMEMEDIHEVEFAKQYLGGYKHWKTLCTTEWFSVIVQEWREELELVLMSRGFNNLMTALSDDKINIVASKYFLDRAWDQGIHSNPETKRGRGRPTKKALQDKIKESPVAVLEDYKRLFAKEKPNA